MKDPVMACVVRTVLSLIIGHTLLKVSFIISGGISSYKTESYEQLNDVKFEGFKIHSPTPPSTMVTTELVQINTNSSNSTSTNTKDLL